MTLKTRVAGGNQNYLVCNNWTMQDGRNITDVDVQHGTDVAVVGGDVVKSLFEEQEQRIGKMEAYISGGYPA